MRVCDGDCFHGDTAQVEGGTAVENNVRLHDSDLCDVSVFNLDMGITEFALLTGAEALSHGFLCPFPFCQRAEYTVCFGMGNGQSGECVHRKSMIPVPMGDKDSLRSREVRCTDCLKHCLQMRRRVACINQHAVVFTVDISKVWPVTFFVEGQDMNMGRDVREHIFHHFYFMYILTYGG